MWWGRREEYICLGSDHRNIKLSTMHAQNKGVAVHTVDMDFKVKRNLNIKILLQYVRKGNGPGCKINIGESKRRMAAQKVDMGELLGEKTITDFLMVPPRD